MTYDIGNGLDTNICFHNSIKENKLAIKSRKIPASQLSDFKLKFYLVKN